MTIESLDFCKKLLVVSDIDKDLLLLFNSSLKNRERADIKLVGFLSVDDSEGGIRVVETGPCVGVEFCLVAFSVGRARVECVCEKRGFGWEWQCGKCQARSEVTTCRTYLFADMSGGGGDCGVGAGVGRCAGMEMSRNCQNADQRISIGRRL